MVGLKDKSVVITGASSGIGRAAARAFARRGARLTLAARRLDMLEDAVDECRALGGQARAVIADVADPDAVLSLASQAVEAFGTIDIWVNNAGGGVFGPTLAADLDLHRKTIETDLLGSLYGSYAALRQFERQGNRGVLINNISLGGWAPSPFAAAYSAAKFGLRGLTGSLRSEFADRPGIRICAVFPAIIDTPGLHHAANVSGKALNPGPFLYAPEQVAETFVALALRPRDEVAVGWPARAAQLAYTVARGPTERLMGATMRRALARADPAAFDPGGLMQPGSDRDAADGGLRRKKHVPSAGTIDVAAGILLALGGAALLLRRAARA